MAEGTHGDPGSERTWADAADAEAAPPSQPSFFTFWRCCGCLGIVGIFLAIGTVIAFRLALDRGLPTTPLDIPPTEYTAERAAEIVARIEGPLRAGETVTLTPEELTIFVLEQARGEGAEDVRFRCTPTPDGELDIRLSFPTGENPNLWWPLRNRYVNLTLVGNLTLEDGQVSEISVTEFVFGDIPFPTDEASARESIDNLRNEEFGRTEAHATIDRVKTFRFDGEKITLQLVPE